MNKNNNQGLYRIAIDIKFHDGTLDTFVIKDNESAIDWMTCLQSDETVESYTIRSQATQEEILRQITFENNLIRALDSFN